MADPMMSATASGHSDVPHSDVPHAGDVEVTKRDFVKLLAGSAAAIGAGAIAWPMIDSMNPSADVLALSSTEVDLKPIVAGQAITVGWRGTPVFVRNRTPEDGRVAEDVALNQL